MMSTKHRGAPYLPYVLIILLLSFVFFLYYIFDYARYIIDERFPFFYQVVIFEFQNHLTGSLILIPLLYSTVIFWWPRALFVWLITIAAVLPHMIYFSSNASVLIANILNTSVPVLVVGIIAVLLKWRSRERESLLEREKERHTYIAEVLKAQEAERQHIAQELHDGITQTLLAVAYNAEALMTDLQVMKPEQAKERTQLIRDSVLALSEDTRRLSLDLRPSILDNLGLIPSITWLTERTNAECTINVNLIVEGERRKLNSDAELIVFRFIQESLNNVKKHSGASQVVICLDFISETFRVTVQDNGKGFTFQDVIHNLAKEGKLGIIGMKERARYLGGTFNVESGPGMGTRLSLEFTDSRSNTKPMN